MVLASDYPFLDIVGTMLIFFAWVIWFWILIRVLVDVFRRNDISGWGKAAWTFFMIVLPFLGVLIYLIAHGQEMGERDIKQAQANQAQLDSYVRSVASDGAADQIAKAKQLLDSGAIDQAEFDRIKAKALG
jgi:Short C-terminal domain/Phospholipase_D-nuclease N-terminal